MSVLDDKDLKLRSLGKSIDESFVDSVRGLPSDDIKSKIVELNQTMNEQKELQKEDVKLNELKEQVKALNGGYNDIIKEKKKRLNYLLLLLETRGKI